MSTSALIRRQELTPTIWAMIERIAPVMKNSRLFGVATEAQAMAIMAKGYELGLPITAAFEFVTVIQDKPALIPRGALALIYQSGELAGIQIDEQTDSQGAPTACMVTMKRRNGIQYTAKFTMDDAKRADVIKGGSGWEKYPANMLRWRAIGFCADVVFPDVLGGLKRADELGADITPEGEIVATSWREAPVTPGAVGQIEPAQLADGGGNGAVDPVTYLNQLVQRHGAEAIVAANEGRIPSTVEELAAVETALAGEDA